MNFPKEIYADTDLVCGENPADNLVKYVRADLAFGESKSQLAVLLQVALQSPHVCLAGWPPTASHVFCLRCVAETKQKNNNSTYDAKTPNGMA